MASNPNPTDLARETLKLLATRRIAPTPANYQRIYHEISGARDASQTAADRILHALRDIAVAYPDNPPLTNLARTALAGEVEQFGVILTGLAGGRGARHDWSPVIRDLLRHIELRQSATSLARKKEGLERLLINFGSDPLLYDKLQALLSNWAEQPEPGGPVEAVSTLAPASARSVAAPAAPTEQAPMVSSLGEVIRQIKELLAQTLEVGLAGRLQFAPDLAIEARSLAQQAREARGTEAWPKLAGQLKKFWYALELRAEDQNDMLESLLRLLGLMVNNIGELVDEDQWVSGQLAMVTDVINQPLTLERIHEAERGFKEVIYKQSMLKHGLREAKSSFKRLITVFVERLSEMSTSATGYHERIGGYAARLERADALNDLQSIVADLVSDTRSVQVDMMRHSDEIVEVRKQADQAENRVRQLEAELEQVSEQVREDQLTGTLNRRGLDDAMQREISRAQRKRTPMCVAILDLDNFKKLNDTYGHQAGDDALVHLANVVRKTLRPTDTVARFGGEEFVIVFAETDEKQAVEAMRRLQRELTKRFFLHDNERLLITFSAGVAVLKGNETQDAILARADKAMYQAKLQGKNRVVTSE
jgi:diguanylate cyclase